MSAISLSEFAQQTQQKDLTGDAFELESPNMLEVRLNGRVWTKRGSMVCYYGDMKFRREGILDKGLGGLFKKALTGEGATLNKVDGTGRLYLADNGKRITVLRLNNESIIVNGNDVLAFQDSIKHDITMMRRVTGMLAGGLFNVKLSGTGLIAFTTHGHPLTLAVTPGNPLRTDPNTTVAWSANLQPDLKTDISLKTLFGRGSGETIQMEFSGQGIVVVQPYEEIVLKAANR